VNEQKRVSLVDALVVTQTGSILPRQLMEDEARKIVMHFVVAISEVGGEEMGSFTLELVSLVEGKVKPLKAVIQHIWSIIGMCCDFQ
jgi:uncharacterized protein YqeY